MADCWDCGAERERDAFCPSCNKVQPVIVNTSFFATLGLSPQMGLDRKALDKAYRDLSRKVHPDRFGQTSRLERKLALEQTTHVNDAYRTLKKPRTRAEYLMGLNGHKTGAEDDRIDDPMFLMEMLELREALDDGSADRDVLRDKVAGYRKDALNVVATYIDEQRGDTDEALMALKKLRFYERFLEQADED